MKGSQAIGVRVVAAACLAALSAAGLLTLPAYGQGPRRGAPAPEGSDWIAFQVTAEGAALTRPATIALAEADPSDPAAPGRNIPARVVRQPDGSFRATGLKKGRVFARVSGRGYAAGVFGPFQTNGEYPLALKAVGAVTARILDDSTEAVISQVTINGQPFSGRFASYVSSSGSSGEEVELIISALGYETQTVRAKLGEPAAEPTVFFRLKPMAGFSNTLGLRFVDAATGEPRAVDFNLSAEPVRPLVGYRLLRVEIPKPGADGWYRLKDLPEAVAYLNPMLTPSEGFDSTRPYRVGGEFTVRIPAGSGRPILRGPGRLIVRFVDAETSQAVTGMTIGVYDRKPSADIAYLDPVKEIYRLGASDLQDGQYTVAGLSAPAYLRDFGGRYYLAPAGPFELNREHVVPMVARKGFGLRLLDARTGKPILEPVLTAAGSSGWHGDARPGDYMLRFQGRTGGKVRLEVKAAGYFPLETMVEPTIDPAEPYPVFKLDPRGTTELKLVIVDKVSQRPVGGAVVAVAPGAWSADTFYTVADLVAKGATRGVAAADGSSAMQERMGEPSSIYVAAKGYANAMIASSLRPAPGADGAVHIELSREGIVDGTFTDGGRPVADAQIGIWMCNPIPLPANTPEMGRSARTDAQGRFRFDGLPPHGYTVYVVERSGKAPAQCEQFFLCGGGSERGELGEGEHATVALLGTAGYAVVSGTVYTKGKPQPNPEIDAIAQDPASRVQYLRWAGDPQGGFKTKPLAPGKYALSWNLGNRHTRTGKIIDVKEDMVLELHPDGLGAALKVADADSTATGSVLKASRFWLQWRGYAPPPQGWAAWIAANPDRDQPQERGPIGFAALFEAVLSPESARYRAERELSEAMERYAHTMPGAIAAQRSINPGSSEVIAQNFGYTERGRPYREAVRLDRDPLLQVNGVAEPEGGVAQYEGFFLGIYDVIAEYDIGAERKHYEYGLGTFEANTRVKRAEAGPFVAPRIALAPLRVKLIAPATSLSQIVSVRASGTTATGRTAPVELAMNESGELDFGELPLADYALALEGKAGSAAEIGFFQRTIKHAGATDATWDLTKERGWENKQRMPDFDQYQKGASIAPPPRQP